MLILLIKIILSFISTFLSLVCSLILASISRFLVLFIQAFRVPGQAIQGILDILANIIKSWVEYLVEILLKAIYYVISSMFDHLVEAISGSAVSTGSTIVELVGKLRETFESLFIEAPEVGEVTTNLITNLLENLFDNYKDAIGYILENAF
ncbi:hypothetical protein LIER_23702 [Lithospermum erythrorhizon]|uniref:Uncharacterized protein n=1 Tax=Lithospermum erythrorhizon TaxID=34254 RepID=A0AAV3R2M3_LITER